MNTKYKIIMDKTLEMSNPLLPLSAILHTIITTHQHDDALNAYEKVLDYILRKNADNAILESENKKLIKENNELKQKLKSLFNSIC